MADDDSMMNEASVDGADGEEKKQEEGAESSDGMGIGDEDGGM